MDSASVQRPDRPIPDSFEKVLIVGLGKVTGVAVAEALLGPGIHIRVAERTENAGTKRAAAELAARGIDVIFDDEDTSLAAWADLLVPSPGVPPSNPLLRYAFEQGIPIWSEIEIGWRLAGGPVLAITGTNGKTTTTELLTFILTAASIPASAAGNIGIPLVGAARSATPETVLVTEVSSFQLAYIDRFRPAVAVVLNVADDHYDWHGNAGDYLAAKARITANQRRGDLLVANARDPRALSIAAGSAARLGVFGVDPPRSLMESVRSELGRTPVLAAGISEGSVVIAHEGGDTRIMDTSDIRLAGRHNLQNVLAASSAAFFCKCSAESISKGVREFKALPHRMNLIAERDGIKYIDDSKATNPHAALAALEGLQNVILIAGGRSKGVSLQPLEAAAEACKGAVVMGEAASELKAILSRLPLREARNIEEAVEQATQMARPGDIVLLSPGCSSLDQYSSYAERGDRFVQAVSALG